MTDTLAQLIDRTQIMLLDATGTRYTDATVTAAIRQALNIFNNAAPRFGGTLMDVIADQVIYELDEAEEEAEITAVLLSEANQNDTPLDFTAYWQDNRLFFRLTEAQEAGEQLNVMYSCHNTVAGLDGAGDSTLRAADDQTLVSGAAYYALLIRAVGQAESINLNTDVPETLRETAAGFSMAFSDGLRKATKRKPYIHSAVTTADLDFEVSL